MLLKEHRVQESSGAAALVTPKGEGIAAAREAQALPKEVSARLKQLDVAPARGTCYVASAAEPYCGRANQLSEKVAQHTTVAAAPRAGARPGCS